ncbi:MAG: tetratricopeptide repeat protein [Ignavibacteriales bacterium]|nr:tetratricopeptide repeat protein [Ignavibacteriales bacterium]
MLLCAAFSVAMGSFAYFANGGFGFPLDDPWIHLQFARNLADHGSFSYYKDEMPTSGSTAPLYTLMLTAGFLVTNHEILLSYVLGALFYLVAVAYFFKLAERIFPGRILYALGGTLLFALEPRLHWIALSGMETTLFITLSLAVVHYYASRNGIGLGIAAGCLLWTRPEAVILFGALAAEFVYSFVIKDSHEQKELAAKSNWLTKSIGIAGVIALGYAGFNLALSGTLLPNTYAAKLAYYSGTGTNFPAEVFRYLTDRHMVIVAILAAAGILQTGLQLSRRQHSMGLIPLLFSSGLFLAYWYKLPYLYQNGRYLMPVIPFYLLIGLAGMEWILATAAERLPNVLSVARARLVGAGILAVLGLYFGLETWNARESYKDHCTYVSDRQVKTAFWIRENLPDSAVVATHDVGALAFYSGRKIVDMVGLISPEMIARIGNLPATKQFLVERGVTHLAVLRNWFEAVNVNPIFQTNEATPEIMEVFAFEPDRMHFTTGVVAWLTATGWLHLSRGDLQQGGPLVERAVQLDSLSSRAHHHFGWALMMAGKLEEAEREFRTALALNPEYWSAYFALTQVPLRQNHPREAIRRLEALVKMNPKMLAAYQSIAQIYGQMGETDKAEAAMKVFRMRMELETNP